MFAGKRVHHADTPRVSREFYYAVERRKIAKHEVEELVGRARIDGSADIHTDVVRVEPPALARRELEIDPLPSAKPRSGLRPGNGNTVVTPFAAYRKRERAPAAFEKPCGEELVYHRYMNYYRVFSSTAHKVDMITEGAPVFTDAPVILSLEFRSAFSAYLLPEFLTRELLLKDLVFPGLKLLMPVFPVFTEGLVNCCGLVFICRLLSV